MVSWKSFNESVSKGKDPSRLLLLRVRTEAHPLELASDLQLMASPRASISNWRNTNGRQTKLGRWLTLTHFVSLLLNGPFLPLFEAFISLYHSPQIDYMLLCTGTSLGFSRISQQRAFNLIVVQEVFIKLN